MKALLIAVALSSSLSTLRSQNTTADELRRLEREMQVLREEQEMAARRSRAESSQIADELRKIQQIEEEKLRDARKLQEEAKNADRARQIQEYYANIQATTSALETQIGRGESLSREQLDWIRAVGLDLKAQLESPHTQMTMEMIRETEQGFTGVGGTLPLSKASANAAKQRILRDQSLFNRLAAINQGNAQLTAPQEVQSSIAEQDTVSVPTPTNLGPAPIRESPMKARKRALMEKMGR